MDTNTVNVRNLLDQVTNGLNLSEQVKQSILSIYMIGSFKIILEALIACRANDPQFSKDLVTFLDTESKKIAPETKLNYDKLVREETTHLFAQVVQTYSSELSVDSQTIITQNLNLLTKSLKG